MWTKIYLILCLIAALAIAFLHYKGIIELQSNGRFSVWEQVFKDFKGPCILMPVTKNMTQRQKIEVENLNKRTYSLTGRGMGSFPYIYSAKHNSEYENAHNEHLEFPYSIGLIGYILFMMAIGFVLWRSFLPARRNLFLSACYVSFLFSVIAAFGIPLWHVEPLRFYSVIMFIFLSSSRR